MDEVDDLFQDYRSVFSWGGRRCILLDRRPLKGRGFAGNSTRGPVSLGACAAADTNVPGAAVSIPSFAVLNKKKVAPVTLQEKGTTPVRLEKMLPFLNRYPDRAAAVLLEAGGSVSQTV